MSEQVSETRVLRAPARVEDAAADVAIAEEDEAVGAAVLIVRMPSRDELRAMSEIGRQTEGRSAVVAL